jgi:DNA-binding sugar fermentation-stimulating protein
MAKLSEETMREFINSNINCLPETTKASLDKYDLVTQYRKVRYYLGQAEKKNKPVVVNVVDQVMNIIKNSTITAVELEDLMNQIDVYKDEVKAQQITDIETQIKQLQGQLKELKK